MFAGRRLLTSVLMVVCLLPGMALAQLSYTNTLTANLPDNPGGLAVAVFDRSGKPDLAVIHGTTLSLFFNQGAGKFGTAIDTPLTAGSVSVDMLAADVNHDGNVDLVIAQSQPQQIVVLLGRSNGTFQLPLTFALVNPPLGIALGDVNNDGNVDLAVRECPVNSTNCDIAVYLGQGTGAFTPTTVLPASGANTDRGRNLAVTDFNRDGKLDIATSGLGGSSASPTAHFTVYLGNGDGTFRQLGNVGVPMTIPAESVAGPPDLVAGDFNNDATDDIGVDTGSICGGSACGHSTMHIFTSNGGGGFTARSSFPSANNEDAGGWIAADLNNNLNIDLVRISQELRTGNLQTWSNNGSATFTSIGNNIGSSAAFAEVRDLDLDGRHDLIQNANGLGESDVIVGINHNGTPNCAPPPSNTLQAKLCTPGTTTSSTTFTVRASGNSPLGIKRLELWVDGTKRAQVADDQLLRNITLTAGSHRITIVAVDKYIGIAKTTRLVSVK